MYRSHPVGAETKTNEIRTKKRNKPKENIETTTTTRAT